MTRTRQTTNRRTETATRRQPHDKHQKRSRADQDPDVKCARWIALCSVNDTKSVAGNRHCLFVGLPHACFSCPRHLEACGQLAILWGGEEAEGHNSKDGPVRRGSAGVMCGQSVPTCSPTQVFLLLRFWYLATSLSYFLFEGVHLSKQNADWVEAPNSLHYEICVGVSTCSF